MFTFSDMVECLRHLYCISFDDFKNIKFHCDTEHMWDKLKVWGPSSFICDLDEGNRNALEVYLKEYLKQENLQE